MLKLINSSSKPSLLSLVQKSFVHSNRLAYGYNVGEDWVDDDDYPSMGEYHNLYSGLYDGYDNGWDNEDDVYVPPIKKGSVTRRSGSKHKKHLDDLKKSRDSWVRTKHLMRDIDDDDTVGLDDDKMIYYYSDPSINNDVIEFKSLLAFGDFLDSEGIQLSELELSNLSYRTVSHCCINPLDKQLRGELNLVSEHSYGALYYTCCEPCD